MEHHFDIKDAEKYGIEEAIFINNFKFWINKNRANGNNFFDGRTWTYNSVSAFKDMFPYMSLKKIRYTLNSLVKQGVIITGNYNKRFGDRTLWYAFQSVIDFLPDNNSEKGQTEIPKRANTVPQKGRPLPYINTDNNTDINTNTDTPKKPILNKHVIQANTLEEAQELWDRDHLHEKVYLMPYKGGGYFPITREYLGEDFFTLHANKDIPKLFHNMQAWLIANPDRLKTNYRRYIGTWVSRNWQ